MKDHGRQYIIGKLREAGVIHSKNYLSAVQVFHRWTTIKRNLKLRRKPPGMYCVANDAEIYQIIKEFSPGDSMKNRGDGWWEPGKARFEPEEEPIQMPDNKVYEELINKPVEMLYPETPLVIPEQNG